MHEDFDQLARHELDALFAIERALSRSACTVRYLARERAATQRLVTVQALSRDAARAAGIETAFVRAATQSAGLDHPHILPVLDSGATAAVHWYAAPHVEGRPLSLILEERGTLDVRGCRRVAEQVASALACAHRHHVVHGAVSAARVLMNADGWVVIGDFGLASLLSRARQIAERPGDATVAPPWRPTGPADDQYQLALMLRDALGGLSRPDLPEGLAEALQRALHPDPFQRFASVTEFAAILDGVGSPGESAATATSPPSERARPLPSPPPVLMPPTSEKPRRPPKLAVLAAACLIAIVVAARVDVASLGADRKPYPAVPRPPLVVQREQVTRLSAPVARVSDPVAPPLSEPVVAAPPRAAKAPRRIVVARAAPPPALPGSDAPISQPSPAPEPAGGRLAVNAVPWGQVYLDGVLTGNTPQMDLPVSSGSHRLRVTRAGFQPVERVIQVAPGQDVRVTDIALRPSP